MGMLDAAVHIGRESEYGSRQDPTRSFEATTDPATRQIEHLESRGMRAGMHAMRTDRRIPINMGAEGPLTLDVLNRGFGMLLRAAIGTASIDQIDSTDAYEQTFATGKVAADESLTVQVERPVVDESEDPEVFEYTGGTVTSWEFTQSNSGLLVATLEMDYQDEQLRESAASPAYPAGSSPFHWVHCKVLVDNSEVEPEEFSITGNTGRATDRRRLRQSALKKQPIRNTLPIYTGEISNDFVDTDVWEAFRQGTILPLKAIWEAGLIADGDGAKFTIEIDCPAIQFDGATPQVEEDGFTDQPAPFVVLHNGSDPAVTITYTSDDTAH